MITVSEKQAMIEDFERLILVSPEPNYHRVQTGQNDRRRQRPSYPGVQRRRNHSFRADQAGEVRCGIDCLFCSAWTAGG